MKHLFTFIILFVGYFTTAQTFENMDAGLPDLSFSMTAFGDVDGDGDLDVYVSGYLSDYTLGGGLYIYEEGSYTLSTTAVLPNLSMGSARWGDIDNDGDVDLLVMGLDDPNEISITNIYLNNNDGTFSNLELGFFPGYMGEVALVDFNNDTYLDVAVTGFDYVSEVFATKLYKNNTDNTFTELTSVDLPGMNMGRIKFADYDNDDDQDFVLSGWGGDDNTFYTRIFNNNGDETFTESGIPLLESWLGDTEWGDFNADGNIDLIISGASGSGEDRNTLIYRNNGDGSFTDIEANIEGVSHSSLEWGDFDNDGDLDVLITGATTAPDEGNYIYNVYNNMGDDSFLASTTTILQASYYGDADSGDIDGDGKIDVIISGFSSALYATSASNVFMNTTTVSIDDLVTNAFSIYPNPNTDRQLVVNFDEMTINTSSEVAILTVSGVCVYTGTVQQNETIDLSHLASGTYLVKLVSNDKVGTKKLLIK